VASGNAGARRPTLRVARGSRMAVLFADMAGSTALYEALGDAEARRVVAGVLALVGHEVRRAGGVVLKEIGDASMAAFTSAQAAARAACEIQAALAATREGAAVPRRVQLRIGLHIGPVIVERGDLFGDSVNVAARVAARAKPAQILTTAETVAALPAACRRDTRRYGVARLKGKATPFELHEILWEVGESTRQLVRSPTRIQAPATIRLTLVHAGVARVFVFRPGAGLTVTLGRDARCDLAVDHPCVSRNHADIECRGGRWLALLDHSFNGTFVRFGAKPCVKVVQEQYILELAGELYLGSAPAAGGPDTRVCFRAVVEEPSGGVVRPAP